MNTQQQAYTDTPNTFKENGNISLLEDVKLQSLKADSLKEQDINLLLQLQTIQEHNIYLEGIINQTSKKLRDVIATNNKFVSIIAHDLRGPFCSIIMSLDLLKKELELNNHENIKGFINLAQKSADRTLNLVNDLLEWTTSQDKGKNFCPVKINLHDILTQEIESNLILTKHKNITLRHTIPKSINVIADVKMVKTIIRNLIANAIKFTELAGEIVISATENNEFVEIIVKDNGVGISLKSQRNLFKKSSFYSTAGTDNEKGSGLGLLLCKEFVKMHGGQIEVKSERGKGSEFKFTLSQQS